MIKPSDYKLKVMLGLPFCRYVPPEWAVALATIAWPMNIRYAYCPIKNMPREEARTEIVERGLNHRSEFIAMLDDDIQPPADFLQVMLRELESRPEFDIISAVSPSHNREPMVFKQRAGGPFWRWKVGEIFEIAECSTACILIRSSLFKKLPKPWFRDLNNVEETVEAGVATAGETDRGYMTDDIYFCRKATDFGARILAHGAVLPIHWDRKGNYYELPKDSYPFQGGDVTVETNPRVDISKAQDIHGWMSKEELLWLATEASRITVKNIAEIGSWEGRSTRAFADNTQATVYAIDTWAGSPECGDMSKLPVDFMLDKFKYNTSDLPNIKIIQMTSLEAAQSMNGTRFDIVFIDAEHSYESVRSDILAWKPLVAPGGIICGHDYDEISWPGVVDAVNELLPGAKRGAHSIWYDVVDY